MKFCPQCGKELIPGNRFCEQCGYDLSAEMQQNAGTEISPRLINPEVADSARVPVPPTVPPAHPPMPPQPSSGGQKPVSPPPLPGYSAPSGPKKHGMLLWIIIGIAGIGALGAGGWFGYTKFFRDKPSTVTASDSSIMTDESTPARSKPASAVQPLPDSAKPAGPGLGTPAESKPSPAPKTVATVKNKSNPKAPDPSGPIRQQTAQSPVKTGPSVAVKPDQGQGKTLITLFSSNKRDEPKYKNPRNPTRFTLSKAVMVVRLITDHFNNNNGTGSAGSISILDKGKKVIGTYKAHGKTGSKEVPNGKWVAEPQLILQPGTYYIQDSDPSTWSKTFLGDGFAEVEGYEL